MQNKSGDVIHSLHFVLQEQRDCPRQPYVPIYLLVTGVVTIMLAVLSILPSYAYFGNHSVIWKGLVSLFFFGWFIAGKPNSLNCNTGSSSSSQYQQKVKMAVK